MSMTQVWLRRMGRLVERRQHAGRESTRMLVEIAQGVQRWMDEIDGRSRPFTVYEADVALRLRDILAGRKT